MSTIRLTAAQALVRYLAAQEAEPGVPFIAGVWAIPALFITMIRSETASASSWSWVT